MKQHADNERAMDEIRCSSCSRLLAEGQYERLKIRCQRCGAWNLFTDERASRPEPQHAAARPTTGRATCKTVDRRAEHQS